MCANARRNLQPRAFETYKFIQAKKALLRTRCTEKSIVNDAAFNSDGRGFARGDINLTATGWRLACNRFRIGRATTAQAELRAPAVERGGSSDQSREAFFSGPIRRDRGRIRVGGRRYFGCYYRGHPGAGHEAQFRLRPGRAQISAPMASLGRALASR